MNRIACSAAAFAVALCSSPSAQQRITRIEPGLLFPQFDVVGDFDGDGLVDLVYSLGDVTQPRTVRIVTAATGQVVRDISVPAGTQNFAFRVAAVGDTNGDGLDDVAIADSILGRLEIHEFSTTSPRTFLADLGSGFARSVAGAGDVNGDGRADVVIAIATPLPTQIESVRVLSGVDGSTLRDTPLSPVGNPVVRGLGDVTGDGVPDYSFTAQEADGSTKRGGVIDGANGNLLFTDAGWPLAYVGSEDFSGDGLDDLVVIRGALAAGSQLGVPLWTRASAGDRFVEEAASLGDLDNDGLAEVAFGLTRPSNDAASIEVARGSDGSTLRQIVVETPDILRIVRAGDINGNGTQDLAIVAARLGIPSTIEIVDLGFGLQRTERIFGTSCTGGSIGRPLIGFGGSAALGDTLSPVSSGTIGVAPATLLLGTLGAVPLDFFGLARCTLYVSPFATVSTTTDPSGRSRVDLPVPSDPSLTGYPLTMQWVMQPPSSPQALPLNFSNALQVVVGP